MLRQQGTRGFPRFQSHRFISAYIRESNKKKNQREKQTQHTKEKDIRIFCRSPGICIGKDILGITQAVPAPLSEAGREPASLGTKITVAEC